MSLEPAAGGALVAVERFGVPRLVKGASKMLMLGAGIPSTQPVGSYLVLVCLDVGSQIQRFEQSNNCLQVAKVKLAGSHALPLGSAPSTSILSGPSGVVGSASASFAFDSSGSSATFQCRLDRGSWAACSSPRAYSGLLQGPHSFAVRAVAGGVVDLTPATSFWTVDSIAPTDGLISPAKGAFTNQSEPTFSGTAGAASWDLPAVTLLIYAGSSSTGAPVQTLSTTASGGVWSMKASAALADGVYTVVAKQSDEAGNVGLSPADSFTVQTAPPTTTINVAPSGDVPAGAVQISFSSSQAGSTFECNLDGGAYTTCSSPFTTPSLAGGPHTFSVQATDLAQNTGQAATASWNSTAAEIDLCGTIASNETLSPNYAIAYVLTCAVEVPSGVTLTAEPGTIIKGSQGTRLSIDGSLVVDGTSGSSVTFTSVKDDSVGGDTSGDGDAASPAPGDWSGIYLTSTGSASLSDVQIYYADTALYAAQSSPSITGIIENDVYGIVGPAPDGNGTCTSGTVTAQNVNWGTIYGPAPDGSGPGVTGCVDVVPWVGYLDGLPAIPATPGPIPPPAPNPQLGQGPSTSLSPQPGAAPNSSPAFGIADANTAFEGYYASNAFTTLKNDMDANGRSLNYVRFFVPYDTLGSYDTAGSCTWSYDFMNHGGGGAGSAWATLVTELQDATSAGLTPEIVIDGPTADGQEGGSIDGVTFDPLPIAPEAAYGSTSSVFAGWTTAGYEYSCGLEYLVYYLTEEASTDRYNAVWGLEAWNEPNGATQSNSNGGGYNEDLPNACETNPNNSADPASPATWNECSGTSDPSTGASYNAGGALCGSTGVTWCGPLEAAYLWALTTDWEQYWIGHVSGFVGQQQAALTLSDAENITWFNAYWTALNGIGGCLSGYYCFGWYPGIWAVHDYHDPTSAVSNAGNDINAFTSDLYGKIPGSEQVWITESAVDLTSTTTSDDNLSAGCSSLESDDNGSFAGCVDGQPNNQIVGAESFLNLATHSADGIPITQILWYEFQAPNADTGWDSGLLAPPQPGSGAWSQVAPDGVYGSSSSSTGLREGYCVLAGLPAVDCSATDGYHWSIQPRSVTGNLTNGSETVTGITGSQSGLPTYAWVTCSLIGVTTCSGIPANTTVTSGIGTSTWTLSAPATVTGDEDLTASG